jgi:hypothetical protein
MVSRVEIVVTVYRPVNKIAGHRIAMIDGSLGDALCHLNALIHSYFSEVRGGGKVYLNLSSLGAPRNG